MTVCVFYKSGRRQPDLWFVLHAKWNKTRPAFVRLYIDQYLAVKGLSVGTTSDGTVVKFINKSTD